MPAKISKYGPVTEFMPDLDACEGKTIASIYDECPHYSDYKVIRFTDGTALAIEEMEEGGYRLDGNQFDSKYHRAVRVFFGMESAEQYADDIAAEEAVRAAEAEAQERARYEALKAKFG